MITVSVSSLSGGQGKSCCSLFLGRFLARNGYSVLLVDGDPQHSLSTYLDIEIASDQPTLLEVFTKAVGVEDAVYKVQEQGEIYLIPADGELIRANDFLAESGAAIYILRQRLKNLAKKFQYCIVDSPPQRSQIALSILGAADYVLIPTETTVKGYVSLTTTLEVLQKTQELVAHDLKILGVVPFRDRWFGRNQSQGSKECVEFIREEVGDLLLPSIRESEQFKKAINNRKSLKELGYPDLEYPFEIIAQRLGGKLDE